MFDGKHYYHSFALLVTQFVLFAFNLLFAVAIYASLRDFLSCGFNHVKAADWVAIAGLAALSTGGPALVFGCIAFFAYSMHKDGVRAVQKDLRGGACLRDVRFSA